MIFYIQAEEYFSCAIDAWDRGEIKVYINDKFDKKVKLPHQLEIKIKCSNTIYKVQLKNCGAELITIGPVIRGKIVEIKSWGKFDIDRLYKPFENNDNEIIKVPKNIPKRLKDLSYFFYGTGARYIEGIETWDVSHVTDMSYMFYGAENFNQDISNWDTSSVKDISYMFCGAKSFNQDITKWRLSSVLEYKGVIMNVINMDRELFSKLHDKLYEEVVIPAEEYKEYMKDQEREYIMDIIRNNPHVEIDEYDEDAYYWII